MRLVARRADQADPVVVLVVVRVVHADQRVQRVDRAVQRVDLVADHVVHVFPR